MRIGLCMIVKDEAHIIHESLACTLPLIDTYCIVDTGSSDDTIQKIKDFYSDKGVQGEVYERPWKNFGHNRSEALALCDGKMDYIIVIDADDLMGFPKNGKHMLCQILEQTKPNGAQLIIKQGNLEYWRGQIFKADDGWKYVGVLHEYPSNGKPDCKQIKLPKEFWMESRRLGGRNKVGNKAQRDVEVLTKGLEEEPDNDRYVFYLAQSHKDAGNIQEALKYYKKRFKMGRWPEEAWYSAYRAGECYKFLNNIPKFEYWMQKAHAYRPWRAEPIYQLTQFFRVNSQLHKAYHYMEIGRKIGFPKDDVLFVEKFPYEGGFDYEASILDYYVHSDKKVGLYDSIKYLLRNGEHTNNVISNLKFYTSAIPAKHERVNIKSPFPPEFNASAISVLDYPYANSRFVNYQIQSNGSYKTPTGIVITRNAYINVETGESIPIEDPTPLFESEIRGIEDLRLYKVDGVTYFTSTSYKQYIKDKISIVAGTYDIENKRMINVRGIKSPMNSNCEKNWVNIPNTHDFIYSWHPFRIGRLVDDRLIIFKEIETPPLFHLFRGSAPPMKIGDKWQVLVHFVEYCVPRKYYHCFVEFNEDWKLLRVSLPFYFKHNAIEYCISTRHVGESIECYVSFNDCNPHKIIINKSTLEWVNL